MPAALAPPPVSLDEFIGAEAQPRASRRARDVAAVFIEISFCPSIRLRRCGVSMVRGVFRIVHAKERTPLRRPSFRNSSMMLLQQIAKLFARLETNGVAGRDLHF